METIGATRLADLVGDLGTERPPVYAALAARLRLLVGDGRLPVGVRLPAERDLAATLYLSRSTVTAAYRRLREDGWADARQGSGTWTRLPAGPHLGMWLPAPAEAGVIDLAHAALPAPAQVPAAFTAALAELPRFLPGHGYHPHGLPDLRARIAERFTRRGLPTTPEEIVVTGGSLHGVVVTLQALCRPAERVLVEHPSYPNVLDAITSLGLRQVPVPVQLDRPDAVARDLHRAARQTGARAAYLMPDFQNPTGLLLDEPQRRRLAVGLEQTGTVAIVDETMVDLGLDAQPPVPFAALTRPELAVTVGSTSKSFWGGLRVGWVRAAPDLARRIAAVAARAQMSGPVLEQLAVCQLLEVGEVVRVQQADRLRQQRAVLVEALRRLLPQWQVPVPSGGLVLWCALPPGLSSTTLAAAGQLRGLQLAAGPRFGTGHAFDDRLRLPYTQPPEALTRAVALLADVAGSLGEAPPAAVADPLVV